MRKALKNNLLEIFKTIYEAHEIVKGFIDKKEYDNAQNLLADCQDTAIQLGNLIEESEGEGFVTVSFLEEYCEALYEAATNLSEETNGHKVQKQLDKKIIKAENSAKNDIKVKLEIVFMPYKASMWDSLESVWKAADEDPDCDAYVVPIPYYDRKPDHSFGKFHYEGNEYPDYVPVVHYESYNLEQRRPDVIYIHNPYDGNNYVTSVDPRFYSSELKKYTDKLVYIPYFVASDYQELASAAPFVAPESIKNINYVVYQSPVQVDLLNRITTQGHKSLLLGNPKLDCYADITSAELPSEAWKKCLEASKTILLTSTLDMMLSSTLLMNSSYIEFITKIFDAILKYEDIMLIWRPHPLMKATIESMRPSYKQFFDELIRSISSHKRCIIDANASCIPSFYYSDALITDGGSMTRQYMVTQKPLLDIFGGTKSKYTAFDTSGAYCSYKLACPDIDNIEIFSELSREKRMDAYIKGVDIFCRMILNDEDPEKNNRINFMRNSVVNCDGTAGEKVHQKIKSFFR